MAQSDEEIRGGFSELSLQKNALTPEFYELIFDADPNAVNDDYYVTSEDFLQLHFRIKKNLILGLIGWAAGLCLFMAGLAYVYQ